MKNSLSTLSTVWKGFLPAAALACLLTFQTMPANADGPPAWLLQAEARQKALDATPAGQNGFTLLEPFLKKEDADIDMVALKGYFAAWPKMLKIDAAAFEKDRARFAKSMPLLKEAFTRPVFHYPSNWEMGTEATIPYLIVLRDAARSYLVEAKARGDIDMAFEPMLLARHVSEQGSLIAAMVSVAINNNGLDTLFPLVSQSPLNTDQLRALQKRFEDVALPTDGLALAWDDEIARVEVTLDRTARGLVDPGMEAEMKSHPDLKGKINTLFETLWEEYRPLVAEAVPTSQWMEKFEARLAELAESGDAGAIVAEIASGISGSAKNWEKMLARQQAFRLVLALRLYQVEKGEVPSSLASLPDSPPDWSKLGYKRIDKDSFQLDAPIWATEEPTSVRDFQFASAAD